MWKPLIVLAVLVTACASPGTPQAGAGQTPSAAAVPPSPAETSLVALESAASPYAEADTIVIAGLDGHVRASTTFKPRSRPWVGGMVAGLPEIAHVAAGRAYYIDGDGVVRSMGPRGDVRQETRFPITGPQQEASFAVSPDGRQLVGAVVTLPPSPNPRPAGVVAMPASGYSTDVLTATAGSAATRAYHQDGSRDGLGAGAQFVAWDPRGPLATYPSFVAAAGGGPHHWNGIDLVHFPDGRPGDALPVPNRCHPLDVVADGTYLCFGDVRALDGSLIWRWAPANDVLFLPFLAPDAQHVVDEESGTAVVFGRDGSRTNLPRNLAQAGWVDSHTIAGIAGADLAYVSLSDPGRVVDLGFKGAFVAGLATP